MAIVRQSGTVDLIPEYNRQLRPVFCVSEGDDDSRVINLSITSGGEVFPIPSGAMVYIAGKKQDNNIFVYRCSYTSNTVVFPITAQMTADDGIVLCELQVIVDGDPLGSANFVYWVEPSPIQNGTTSESDLNLFEQALAQFEKFDHFYADVEAMVTEAVANMQIREGQTVIDASLTVEGAAADAKATGDIVRAFMDALVTESTAEAAIATCDDAAGGLPLKRLVANIEPAQAGSGDPSPDNVRPISGYTGVTVTRTGKNLLDNTFTTRTVNGTVFTLNDDKSITVRNTPSALTRVPIKTGLIAKSDPDVVLFFSSGTLPTGVRFFAKRVYNGATIYPTMSPTATMPVGAEYYDLYMEVTTSFDGAQFTTYPQIELGTTATEYEPYNGATYPIAFPTEAGTVYGGTLTVNSDGSGTLTVDKTIQTLDGDSNVGKSSRTSVDEYFLRVSGNAIGISGTHYDAEHIICSHAPNISADDSNVIHTRQTGSQPRIVFPLTYGMSDLTAFKTWLAEQSTNGTPLQFCYMIATPTTYALSAVQVAIMLNGVNNIWTDAAGTLTTEYYASTGLYVEKRVNAQRNMIAGVEDAMVATQNYSVGDLLIVGNTLYKVTAAVSSGAALVVGTNVTETTVAEQLLALA